MKPAFLAICLVIGFVGTSASAINTIETKAPSREIYRLSGTTFGFGSEHRLMRQDRSTYQATRLAARVALAYVTAQAWSWVDPWARRDPRSRMGLRSEWAPWLDPTFTRAGVAYISEF